MLSDFDLPDAAIGGQAGRVFLNGLAPTGGAAINLSSSDANLVKVQPAATITGGFDYVDVGLEFRPSSIDKDVTLIATYPQGNSAITAVDHIHRWPPVQIMVAAEQNSPVTGVQTIVLEVVLNAVAPSGGTPVSIRSSNPSLLPIPASVTVPAGRYLTKFTVRPSRFRSPNAQVTITATYGAATASTSITLICMPGRAQRCQRGFYWNSDYCRCVRGQPQ